MDSHPNNTPENAVPPGVTEKQISDAIQKSGYPLQIVIANELRNNGFGLTQEWSFLDRDTFELRTMDVHAQKHFYDLGDQRFIRPQLDLLIECKQSDLPYVFFKCEEGVWIADMPCFAGLKSETIKVTSDDDPSSWNYGLIQLFGMENDEFLTTPDCSPTFSKCVRKGSDVRLSGVESYNGLVLPLIKAQQHLFNVESPVDTAVYFDLHMIISVGVIDAPLIVVECESEPVPKLQPWIRVVRHEHQKDIETRHDQSRRWGIDIVHKSYFSTYIKEHVVPFSQRIAELALRHEHVLQSCSGFVSGMGADSWNNIEQRLKPPSSAPNFARTRAAAKTLFGRSKPQVDDTDQ